MNYKLWLFIAISLFSGGLLLGLATSTNVLSLLIEDMAALDDMVELLAPLPQASVAIFIYLKNASAILISFALSPFFCIVPILALLLNGWLLGVISIAVVQETSLLYLLSGLLPHGVFELPAFFIGEVAALSFGSAVVIALFNREKRNWQYLYPRRNLRFLSIALVLLLPAAVIETYVTPLFL
ncbi:stage II sporulation protein M [Chloroflexota bacterium]